jgi:glucose-6-phosphate 1-dehydrogenase
MKSGIDGEIKAFLNDKEIINYNGITSYTENSGYASKSRYYFKMGLYRDIMQEPMTIYIDEYRKREMTD